MAERTPSRSVFELISPGALARKAKVPTSVASAFLESYRDVLELYVALDFVVHVPGVVASNRSAPVRRALETALGQALKRFEDEADPSELAGAVVRHAERTGDTVARSILEVAGSVPPLLADVPIASEHDLQFDIAADLEVLGLTDGGLAEVLDLLEAWASLVSSLEERWHWPYQRPDLESVLEEWLIENLELLREFGYPVRLASAEQDSVRGRQWAFGDSGRSDLICRFTDDSEFASRGDWLVIELKSVPATEAAIEQVIRYGDALKSSGLASSYFPLLIAPGITESADSLAERESVGFISTAQIGFRRIAALRRAASPVEAITQADQ